MDIHNSLATIRFGYDCGVCVVYSIEYNIHRVLIYHQSLIQA